jgi:hypothetical protein
MYFAFIGRGLNDLGGRSSRFPISKFASGRRDRRPVVFSYRGFVCFFKAADVRSIAARPSAVTRLGCDDTARSGSSMASGLNFLDEGAAHAIFFLVGHDSPITSG